MLSPGHPQPLCHSSGPGVAHAVLGHAAEKASWVHLLDFLGLIFLTIIWAICLRDSLALRGQWRQSKLQECVFDRPHRGTLEAEADKTGLQLAAKAGVGVRVRPKSDSSGNLQRASVVIHVSRMVIHTPSRGSRAEHLERLIPQALKMKEICNYPQLSGPESPLLFKLSRKHFLEESEKEDLNITK